MSSLSLYFVAFYILIAHILTVGSISQNRKIRIIGGTAVKNLDSSRFQASVRINKQHVCGGVIIHTRYILTAAHCEYTSQKLIPLENMSILVGSTNIYHRTMSSIETRVWKRYQHPRYFSMLMTNDISILELESPLTWKYNINPIDLTARRPGPGAICEVFGWGLTNTEQTLIQANPDLMKIEIVILPYVRCQNSFSWLMFDNSKLCGYSTRGCLHLGDSGSPLVCDNKLAGIVSFGRGNKCVKAENSFTSIDYHHKWIAFVILLSNKFDNKLFSRSPTELLNLLGEFLMHRK